MYDSSAILDGLSRRGPVGFYQPGNTQFRAAKMSHDDTTDIQEIVLFEYPEYRWARRPARLTGVTGILRNVVVGQNAICITEVPRFDMFLFQLQDAFFQFRKVGHREEVGIELAPARLEFSLRLALDRFKNVDFFQFNMIDRIAKIAIPIPMIFTFESLSLKAIMPTKVANTRTLILSTGKTTLPSKPFFNRTRIR